MNINLSKKEIIEKFNRKFLAFDFACSLPKNNPFAFPIWQCLESSMCVFDKYDLRFVSTIDYLLFLKKHYVKIDIKDVEMFSCTTDDYEAEYLKKIKGEKQC